MFQVSEQRLTKTKFPTHGGEDDDGDDYNMVTPDLPAR